MRPFLPIVLLGLILGCAVVHEPPTASSIVSSWADLGMYLPSEKDIEFLRMELPQSLDALRTGIASTNEHIRMSSAYATEKLGALAVPLVPFMVKHLQSEDALIVRVYLASALAEVGTMDSTALPRLQEIFATETNEHVRTSLAGALVRLRSPQQEPAAWQWLIESLKTFPPALPADRNTRQEFWERRWSAVKHLRSVPKIEADILPLLRILRDDARTPNWIIEQQISKAIEEMESRTSESRRSTDVDS